MKKPNKPSEPHKPIEPSKIRYIPNRIYFANIVDAKPLSLSDIIALVPKGISLCDVKVIVEEDYDPYEGSSNTNYYLQYLTEQDDPDYERHLKAHDLKIKDYNKKMKLYKTKIEQFEKDQKAYDKWSEDIAKKNKAKEIEILEKRLAKLKKV